MSVQVKAAATGGLLSIIDEKAADLS